MRQKYASLPILFPNKVSMVWTACFYINNAEHSIKRDWCQKILPVLTGSILLVHDWISFSYFLSNFFLFRFTIRKEKKTYISGKPFTPSGKATKQRDDAPKATYAKRLLHDIRLTAASAGVGALLMHPVRQ